MKLQHFKPCFWLFGSFILINSFGCKDKLKVDVPSYLKIDDIVVNTDYFSQGSTSDNIIDAWVFVDDQLIGTYELPVTLPIVETGIHKIEIKAGIKRNGQVTDRVTYPFYQSYTNSTSINLVANETYELTPELEYYSSANFVWLEDFETPNITMEASGNSDTNMVILKDASIAFKS